jgi:hypothetical protein
VCSIDTITGWPSFHPTDKATIVLADPMRLVGGIAGKEPDTPGVSRDHNSGVDLELSLASRHGELAMPFHLLFLKAHLNQRYLENF